MTNTNQTKTLTENQFSVVSDVIDNLVRGARKGTPEAKSEAEAISQEWEAAIALPFRTVDQRATRHAAIAAVATKHNLI